MTPLDSAVIVVCHDRGRTIDEALAALSDSEVSPGEIVILDSGSRDVYTRQVLARVSSSYRLVVNNAATLGAGYNQAVQATTASAIVLVSAHVALNQNCLQGIASLLEHRPDVSFVSPPPSVPRYRDCLDSLGRRIEVRDLFSGDSTPTWSVFRRQAWVSIGGFSEAVANPWEHFCLACLKSGLEGWLWQEQSSREISPARPLAPKMHSQSMEELYRSYPDLVSAEGTGLLLHKDALLLEARERYQLLHLQQQQMVSEQAILQHAIDQTLDELRKFGRRRVELGDLATTEPISPVWGLDRGIPLDRYYITQFLSRHQQDVRGHVLEVKDAGYTRAFGGERVVSNDVIDIDPNNGEATITADLTDAACIGDDTYDCFLLTQTLGVIYDVRAALASACRVLKPGGVLLCTVPASGRISYEGAALDGDFWRFTEASARRLFAEIFPIHSFEIVGFGNVLASAAFLYGLSPHEIAKEDLDLYDPFFPVVYGIRAVKPGRRDQLLAFELGEIKETATSGGHSREPRNVAT